jgi:cell wall-associated NlpC family hydrolase
VSSNEWQMGNWSEKTTPSYFELGAPSGGVIGGRRPDHGAEASHRSSGLVGEIAMYAAAKAGAVVVGAVGPLVLCLVVLAGGTGSSVAAQGAVAVTVLGQLAQDECLASGPVPTLSAAQAANAETIAAAAEALGAGDQGAQIALMVSYTESSLENLGPESGNDASLGLFQQRVSAGWGTASEEQDPTDAAGMFIERLVTIPHWQSVTPWVAAQDVQESAFNGVPSASNHGSSVVGGNYQANWKLAGTFLGAIATLADSVDCGGEIGAEPAGPTTSYGLPSDYAIPSDASSEESLVIAYAISKLGDAYVWGAAGPDRFDCSGLTMMAWAQAGVALAHFTGDQLHEGAAVGGFGAISPGDLVLIPGSDGTLANPGHVGLYIGDGLVLSATDPEQGVIVQTWANFTAGGLSGVRHLG